MKYIPFLWIALAVYDLILCIWLFSYSSFFGAIQIPMIIWCSYKAFDTWRYFKQANSNKVK